MKATKTPSVFDSQNLELRKLYEDAASPRAILCVALDYAKSKHLALCCDGNGDILKAPFPVRNNAEGIDFLVEQIEASARRRNIPKKHIFIGGEDEAPYVSNFISALRARGYLVVRVNAFEAQHNRNGRLASTDAIDLSGIARTMVSRRARTTTPPDDAVYVELREAARFRRILVRDLTAASNRIHAVVDQLFPGFLDHSRSRLTPFTEASLDLMAERFSTMEIARRKPAALAKFLHLRRVHDPEETAAAIIALAREALPPDPTRIAGLQRTLTGLVELHRCLKRNALDLRAESARMLATTPYALLTSLPGIGFVLAAGIAGELGPPEQLRSIESLCAYAGIVPRSYQTGGPDKPAVQGHVSNRCNRILKDWTVQSAQKLHLYGTPEIKDRITRWNANGQHGIYAAAKRYLRLVRALTRNGVPYLEPAARTAAAAPQDITAGATAAWTILTRKWRTIPGGLDLIADSAHPIGFWRTTVTELHGIKLHVR